MVHRLGGGKQANQLEELQSGSAALRKMSSGSALQALLASIGFAEIPPDAAIEAQLRKLFVYYCSFGDIGASALLGTALPFRSPAIRRATLFPRPPPSLRNTCLS